MPRYKSLADRLIANSYLDSETGCWIWTGGVNNGGYPRLSIRLPGGRHVKVYAHRLSLEVFKGKLSARHQAHHTCFRSLCICPDHLDGQSRKNHERLHRKKRRRRAVTVEQHGEAAQA